MKILALDVGDRWTGIAISDPLHMLARPYETVATDTLHDYLKQIIEKEQIGTIVVGLPKTLRSTESEQTKKIKKQAETLKQAFQTITWTFWDERLTSKQAAKLKPTKTKEDKLKIHAIAAALILSSYLEYLRIQKEIG